MEHTANAARALIKSATKHAKLKSLKCPNDATVALALFLNEQGFDAHIEMRWMQFAYFTGNPAPNDPLLAIHIPGLGIQQDLYGDTDWGIIFERRKNACIQKSPNAYRDFSLLDAHKSMDGQALLFNANLDDNQIVREILARIRKNLPEIENDLLAAKTPTVKTHQRLRRI